MHFIKPLFFSFAAMSNKTDSVKAAIEELIAIEAECTLNYSPAAFDKLKAAYKDVEGVQMIRPSGNPLSIEDYGAMMQSDDIEATSHELKSIDSILLVADEKVAISTYKTLSVFSYKGTPNTDYVLFSNVMEEIDGEWKVVHAHRATGQTPPVE
jgi:hypothetical protein